MAARKSNPSPRRPPDPWIELLLLVLDGSALEADLEGAKHQLQQTLETDQESAPEVLREGLDTRASTLRAGGRAPPSAAYRLMLVRLLRRALQDPSIGATPEQLIPLEQHLERLDANSLRPIVGPALRLVIGKPRDGDSRFLNQWLVQFIKETSMADFHFEIDVSSVPILRDDAVKNNYINQVEGLLDEMSRSVPGTVKTRKEPWAAAVIGMVILDGEVDPASSGLQGAVTRAWHESIHKVVDTNKKERPLSEVYEYIAKKLPSLNGGIQSLSVQEFAFVAREVIAGAEANPFGHGSFDSAIRIALDRYVSTRATGDSLSLPPGCLPGGTQNAGGDADLNSDNIRVCGLTYSLALLEKTLVLRVADRIAELFMNGLLPFGRDAAGKAIDDYYWETEDRLTESQRRSQYARMLGMPGGEVSKEVAPNKSFEQLFLRFIASVSEFTRQREVDRMFNNRTSQLSMTGEQVRKSAFELAKNASLYAWGGSFYVATRINKHLDRAIGILNQPQVLKTYAASNHWQVIERVAQQDFGGAPNWVKYSTMAQSANALFGILANKTAAISDTSSSSPFLFDPSFGGEGGSGDLDETTTNLLLRSVQSWLAVNGVRDDQVKQYAQPVEMNTAPSLPGLPGAGDSLGLDVLNKLKQLTANGTPSPDQLQQLLAQLH
ncbi:hypothetical protein [Sphaerotilus microaerophilus]|uniref:Uncharacterized protein n=1 Tax=Sphaerotilus microaerophilus TaxID=2914710 RepID=A0ABN6PPT0_9BURK|nr:hypothetical protein [Sphaerotilus sp. FB-5]BDI06063.1 hypothetical protein CATMQ487_30330 [Sphaerotilus sp. FB-5]